MPVWLMRFLPHGIVILAVGFGLWFIYHKGEKAAEQRAKVEKLEADNRQLVSTIVMNRRIGKVEDQMRGLVSQFDQRLGIRLRDLDHLETTVIQPTITREIRSEARFSDPAAGISDGMFTAINSARATSDPACTTNPDGSATCSMPAAQPVER